MRAEGPIKEREREREREREKVSRKHDREDTARI
jgi:hypothetical protein